MPGAPVFVNLIWDPTLGYNTHTWWDPVQTAAPPPGVPKPNTPNPALEMIATQMWTPGYFLGQNKFTKKTLHMGVPICVADHDQGILIPDITFPPPNLWYLIQWPFSSRKMTFQASTVQMDGNPVSCSQIAPVPLPMMTCGDPLTLPLSFPLVNWTHTLTVGLTLADFLVGLANIAISVAIDALFEWGIPGMGKLIAGKAAKEAGEKAGEKLAKEGAEEAGDTLGKSLLKEAAGKLGLTPKSFAKRVVSGLANFGMAEATGAKNPSFQVGVGGGPVPQVGIEEGGATTDPGRFGTTDVGGVPIGGVVGNTPTDPLGVL